MTKTKVLVSSDDRRFSGLFIQHGVANERLVFKRQVDDTMLQFKLGNAFTKPRWAFSAAGDFMQPDGVININSSITNHLFDRVYSTKP